MWQSEPFILLTHLSCGTYRTRHGYAAEESELLPLS